MVWNCRHLFDTLFHGVNNIQFVSQTIIIRLKYDYNICVIFPVFSLTHTRRGIITRILFRKRRKKCVWKTEKNCVKKRGKIQAYRVQIQIGIIFRWFFIVRNEWLIISCLSWNEKVKKIAFSFFVCKKWENQSIFFIFLIFFPVDFSSIYRKYFKLRTVD